MLQSLGEKFSEDILNGRLLTRQAVILVFSFVISLDCWMSIYHQTNLWFLRKYTFQNLPELSLTEVVLFLAAFLFLHTFLSSVLLRFTQIIGITAELKLPAFLKFGNLERKEVWAATVDPDDLEKYIQLTDDSSLKDKLDKHNEGVKSFYDLNRAIAGLSISTVFNLTLANSLTRSALTYFESPSASVFLGLIVICFLFFVIYRLFSTPEGLHRVYIGETLHNKIYGVLETEDSKYRKSKTDGNVFYPSPENKRLT